MTENVSVFELLDTIERHVKDGRNLPVRFLFGGDTENPIMEYYKPTMLTNFENDPKRILLFNMNNNNEQIRMSDLRDIILTSPELNNDDFSSEVEILVRCNTTNQLHSSILELEMTGFDFLREETGYEFVIECDFWK